MGAIFAVIQIAISAIVFLAAAWLIKLAIILTPLSRVRLFSSHASRLRKWNWAIGMALCSLFCLGVFMLQNSLFERRSAALHSLPEKASKAQVLAVFGEPDEGLAGDSWRYEPRLPWCLSLLKGDDMLITFEDNAMDYRCMMPE